MENTTPMLKQYRQIKERHKDCILFFRLGDFYEMFFEDAKKASAILELVLTSRGTQGAAKVPMCGIPYHAAQNYIAKLVKAGLKVAICEQVEDPALAKGIVKRDVIRVITSGTFIDDTGYASRLIACLSFGAKATGIAFTETASGTIQVNEYPDTAGIVSLLAQLPVVECVYAASDEEKVKALFKQPLLKPQSVMLTPWEDWAFNPEIASRALCEHFAVHNLRGFGIEALPQATASASALLEYLKQMHKQPLRHIDRLSVYSDTDHVAISPSACYGLELESLFATIDHTLSSLGKRKLKEWLFHPLKQPGSIRQRQDAIALLNDSPGVKDQLQGLLKTIPDIEKSITRISCGAATFKDLLALRACLTRIPQLQAALKTVAQQNPLFAVDDIPESRQLLERAINPDIPISHPEGKIIRPGYHAELDSLRDIQENGRQWLAGVQAEEIKRTKINSLKIGFNQVFGYYIEISKANLSLVPPDYIRKQTLVNGERFITPQLKEFEEKMLTAEEKVLKIENELVRQLHQHILENTPALHTLASQLAAIDSLYSLSVLASLPGYCRPVVDDGTPIVIKDGRHPVVEHYAHEPFIPNDTFLDCEENHLLVITGPNMAGKSTYIRQVAVLVILAQIGSFIPAASASIGIVDKVFTRIGAQDDIAKGQSTFMVEMSETAGILNNLSARSLVILDEIGRGTSTSDGLSLAWAVAEHLNKHRVRCLFATHFHELTALAEGCPGVKNYNVEVKEWNDEVIFLHKIIPGGTDDSYGIYVAKLAGIPSEVIARSRHILSELEMSANVKTKIRATAQTEYQLPLFEQGKDRAAGELKKELESLDLDHLTPLEALNKIGEWKKKLKEG